MPHSINHRRVISPVSVRKNAILDTSIGEGNGKGELEILRKTKGTETIVRSHVNSRPRLIHNTATGALLSEFMGDLVLFNPASRFVCKPFGTDS